MKKILALVLALCMVLTLAMTAASADETHHPALLLVGRRRPPRGHHEGD